MRGPTYLDAAQGAIIALQPIAQTTGGDHDPSSTCSVGSYTRSTRLNAPLGAGSQFTSVAAMTRPSPRGPERTASSAQLRRLLRSGAEDKNRNRLQAPPEDERLLDQQQMGSRQLAPAPRLG